MKGKGIIRVMTILNFCCSCYHPMCIQIKTCEFNMLFRKLSQFYFNWLLSIQQDRSIQYNTAFFITVWRRISPAAAPVHTNRKAYFYLIFCNLIFLYLIYITCFKYFLLDCGKAFLLYLVVAGSMKVLFHKLHGTGNAV